MQTSVDGVSLFLISDRGSVLYFSALKQLAVVSTLLFITSAYASERGVSEPTREQAKPKNVVLIIGDGMDDQQITIARNYLKGVRGRLVLDEMPVRASVQVLTVDNDKPTVPVYVADSANSATAMATGQVTSRGRIATSAGDDVDLQTIVELASQAGLKTGIVTTSSVTDATPASFVAHVSLRICEGPDTMFFEYQGIAIDCRADQLANGGKGSISEQIAISGLDVVLGGGAKHFTATAESKQVSVEELATASGFQVIHDKQALLSAKRDQKLMGLFAQSHLPIRTTGEAGRSAEAPEPSMLNTIHWSQGDVELPSAMECVANPEYGDTPAIQLMTRKALDILNWENDKGFFLMIESASIDKQSHERNPCGSIGELEQLDETLAEVLMFTESNPNTLIMVTADHGQAAQMIPDESLFSKFGVPVYTPGKLARIKMPDGTVMAVNYATNNFVAEEHTGVAVPLYANDEAIGLVKTLITQPDIFEITRSYLGL
jgi:alkaline phosphatase